MSDVRVAVIGAGMSGLVAIKSCLEEGLVPVCFEQSAELGGMWNAGDQSVSNCSPQIYDTLITNHSKAMICFSDFPFPNESPTYLTPNMVYEYFLSYAEHFNLQKYIQFKTKIRKISKARDYDETGNWEVSFEESNGNGRVEVFNGIMICSGRHNKPRFPDIEGRDRFEGEIHHAWTFKTGQAFSNKNVVVVGNSFSAGDIATASCEYAKQVHLSVGNGCLLVGRFDDAGIPYDMRVYKRGLNSMWMKPYFKKLTYDLSAMTLNHDVVGMHAPEDKREAMMINDELVLKIMTGKVKVVGRVVKMDQRSVRLDDGTVIDDVNAVVFCTGYDYDLSSFLDENLIDTPEAIAEGKTEWYKMVFPIHLKIPSLAMIGIVAVEGPNFPFFELQSRLAARVMSGRHRLPRKDVMQNDVDSWNTFQKTTFSCYRHQVSYFPFVDEIAEEIGVKPNFWKLFFRHPRLAFSCLFGTASPLQYRLVGPHSNDMAVNYCNDVYKNTFSGVQHRRVPPRGLTLIPTYIKVLLMAVVMFMLYRLL